MLTPTNIAYICSIAPCIILVLILMIRSNKSSSKIFVAFIASIGFWIFTNFMVDNLNNKELLLFWIRLAIIGPLLIGPLFLNFAKLFITDEGINWKFLLMTMLPSILIAPFTFTNLNVSEVEVLENGNVDFKPGFLYNILIIYLTIYISYSLIILINKYRNGTSLIKSQIRFVAIGFLISFIIALITSSLLPLIGYTQFGVIGPLASVIFLGFTTYALIKHRLFGLRFVIGRTVYMLLATAIPYGTFYLVATFYLQAFGSIYDEAAMIIGVLFAFVFINLTFFLNRKISRFIDKSFIDPGLVFSKNRETLLDKFSKTLNIDKLAQILCETYIKVFNLNGANFLLINFENKNHYHVFEHSVDFDIDKRNRADFDEAIKYIINRNVTSELIMEELLTYGTGGLSRKTIEKLLELGISAVFPFQINEHNRVLIILNNKNNNATFTSEEVSFIKLVLSDSSVAIGRSLLYEEVQNFNETLQGKVDIATKRLKNTNERLQEALERERDMMDILGHELRTPLTIAQNAIMMMDMRRQAGTIENEKLAEGLEQAREGIQRETKILDTILSSTRLENERLPINLMEVDAKDVVNDSVIGYSKQAESKGLILKSSVPKKNVACYSDRDATQQIIDNLVSNAVKYTLQGSVEIKLEELEDKIRFSIIDTGEGISKENLKKLGRKFFRINNHLNTMGTIDGKKIVRPGGTGIGLYVVFGLAEKMGGKVVVESEEGKGSKFMVYLPKFKGQGAVQKKLEAKDMNLIKTAIGQTRAGVVNQ